MANYKALILEYMHAISGNPKTDALMDKYISDPQLKAR